MGQLGHGLAFVHGRRPLAQLGLLALGLEDALQESDLLLSLFADVLETCLGLGQPLPGSLQLLHAAFQITQNAVEVLDLLGHQIGLLAIVRKQLAVGFEARQLFTHRAELLPEPGESLVQGLELLEVLVDTGCRGLDDGLLLLEAVEAPFGGLLQFLEVSDLGLNLLKRVLTGIHSLDPPIELPGDGEQFLEIRIHVVDPSPLGQHLCQLAPDFVGGPLHAPDAGLEGLHFLALCLQFVHVPLHVVDPPFEGGLQVVSPLEDLGLGNEALDPLVQVRKGQVEKLLTFVDLGDQAGFKAFRPVPDLRQPGLELLRARIHLGLHLGGPPGELLPEGLDTPMQLLDGCLAAHCQVALELGDPLGDVQDFLPSRPEGHLHGLDPFICFPPDLVHPFVDAFLQGIQLFLIGNVELLATALDAVGYRAHQLLALGIRLAEASLESSLEGRHPGSKAVELL